MVHNLWKLNRFRKKLVCWNEHQVFHLLIKFEENLRWWVDWLGQLTWNDPLFSALPTCFCSEMLRLLCCNLSVRVALNARFTTNRMCAKNNTIYMWHEQAIVAWSRCVISIVACCQSVKLYAHAARAFWLQKLHCSQPYNPFCCLLSHISFYSMCMLLFICTYLNSSPIPHPPSSVLFYNK